MIIEKRSKIEGDFIVDDDVHFLNGVEITGDLRVKSVKADESIHVYGNYIVDRDDSVGGFQTVRGNQEVGFFEDYRGYPQDVKCYQEIGGNQKIKGNQNIGWHQNIMGSQDVSGLQVVGRNQDIGGDQKVGVYYNYSMEVLDLNKIKIHRIVFTPSLYPYYHEREFWLNILDSIKDKVPELINAVKGKSASVWTRDWEDVKEAARKYKKELLGLETLPAIKQAIELQVKTE